MERRERNATGVRFAKIQLYIYMQLKLADRNTNVKK